MHAFVHSVSLQLRQHCRILPQTEPLLRKSKSGSRSSPIAPERRRSATRAQEDSVPPTSVEIGCASLIAGTMVGAGVLALPAVSSPAGFLPTSGALIGTWLYMAASAMLSAEVAVHCSCALGRPSGVSLLSQARLTLGPAGAALSSLSYVFLHFAVLVAYVSQGATIGQHLFASIPHSLAGFCFLGALGFALFALNDEQVDTMNNLLFAGVLVSFGVVLASLLPSVHIDALSPSHANWMAVPRAIPTLLLSCVYHNIVGSVASRLQGDVDRVRRAVLIGSGVPLVMFLAANAIVLAAAGDAGSATSSIGSGGVDPLVNLSEKGGLPAMAIDAFAGLAVATSALGFIEGLNQLWTDARISLLKERPEDVARNAVPSYLMSVIPPIILSGLLPGSFLAAIDIGGLYGVSVLFGILPAAMTWRQRYSEDAAIATFAKPVLPGGRFTLAAMMALPTLLIIYNTWQYVN